jgi:hypothetical protein
MLGNKASKSIGRFLLEGSVARLCELHHMRYRPCCRSSRLVAVMIENKLSKRHYSESL